MRYIYIVILLLLVSSVVSSQSLGVYIGVSNSHCIETDPFSQFEVGGLFRLDAKNERFHTDVKSEWRNTKTRNYWYGSFISYYDFFQKTWPTTARLALSFGAGAGYNGYNTELAEYHRKYNLVEVYASGKLHFIYENIFAELGANSDVIDLTISEYPTYHIYGNFGLRLFL